MSSYIFCKILSFYTRVAQKVFNTSSSFIGGGNPSIITFQYSELIYLYMLIVCSSVRNWIAYTNEANIVNKDSPKVQTILNLVSRAFSLAWERVPSQGKGPGNEVEQSSVGIKMATGTFTHRS